MKAILTWQEKMTFSAVADGQTVLMDAKAPLGQGRAMTPKEMILAGLGGCTAMDVIALMKKHKQSVTSFEVEVDVATSTGGSPMVFTKADIFFRLAGEVDPAIALESVHLSQNQILWGQRDARQSLPNYLSCFCQRRRSWLWRGRLLDLRPHIFFAEFYSQTYLIGRWAPGY
jgi:putative redox protein